MKYLFQIENSSVKKVDDTLFFTSKDVCNIKFIDEDTSILWFNRTVNKKGKGLIVNGPKTGRSYVFIENLRSLVEFKKMAYWIMTSEDTIDIVFYMSELEPSLKIVLTQDDTEVWSFVGANIPEFLIDGPKLIFKDKLFGQSKSNPQLLQCCDLYTLESKWSYEIARTVMDRYKGKIPTNLNFSRYHNGLIVLGIDPTLKVALDADTGDIVWEIDDDMPSGHRRCFIYGENLFSYKIHEALDESTFVEYNIRTGQQIRRNNLSNILTAERIESMRHTYVDDERLVFISNSHNVSRGEPATRKVIILNYDSLSVIDSYELPLSGFDWYGEIHNAVIHHDKVYVHESKMRGIKKLNRTHVLTLD